METKLRVKSNLGENGEPTDRCQLMGRRANRGRKGRRRGAESRKVRRRRWERETRDCSAEIEVRLEAEEAPARQRERGPVALNR